MLDSILRRLLATPLDRGAMLLDRAWITPNRLTVFGLGLGLGSALAAAFQLWLLALALWLASRLADGLDGPLARRRAANGQTAPLAGGFLDIGADVMVYVATVIGVAIGASTGYDASLWPFLLVLAAYYANGTTLFAFSSIAERANRRIDDGRSISFMPSFAGATETIAVHSLWLVVPQFAWQIALVWAALAGADAARQVVVSYRYLS